MTTKFLIGSLDNPFWRFSLQVYQDEQVKGACLVLQNKKGLNVNLLLLCCWLACAVEEVSQPELLNACHSISDWDKQITQTLRQARKALKNLGTEDWGRNFYQQLLKDEITSEAYQQHRLYHCFAKQQKNVVSKDEELAFCYLSWLCQAQQLSLDDSFALRLRDFVKLTLGKIP